jgi:4-amino-4-deoxy-L-arabinose transferase-like glycosyltransferase
VDPVLQLIHNGEYRPLALTQPTLPIYLEAFVAIVHFLWGAIGGTWRSVLDYGPAQVIGWGRAFSALMGAAVVLIVYQVGMRWGARHALLAAGLTAVSPIHVAASREMANGSPLTFFVALTLLLSLIAIERRHRWSAAVAGAAAGLAAACHYAGALVAVMPLIAVWMTITDESSRISRAVIALGAALGVFVVATPLVVRDLPAFLNGVAAAALPAAHGIAGGVDLLGQLLLALQWPGSILVVAGLALGITRAITGPGQVRWTLLVSFPVVYFILAARHGASASTALLPLLPAAVVLAAVAVISGVSLLRRFDIPRAVRTALIAALTVAAVLPPAVVSIQIALQAGR